MGWGEAVCKTVGLAYVGSNPTPATTGAKIAGDPGFAIVENDDVTTAVTVVAVGSPTEPAKPQLLALRSADHRPSQWKQGERLGPLPLQDDQYPADVTHVMIWPDGIAGRLFPCSCPGPPGSQSPSHSSEIQGVATTTRTQGP